MSALAHEDDVLILGSLRERGLYRQFAESQVFTVEQIHRINGRRIRRAYWTDAATRHGQFFDAYGIVSHSLVLTGSGMAHFSIAEWRPESSGLVERIEALKDESVAHYEDWNLAIDRVLELIREEAEANVDVETV